MHNNILDLSIIIVSWNTKQYLRKCVKSVYREIPDISFEIFVVDNASEDGSSDMVRKEFPHVKLVCNEENVGFAKANNQAIEQSRGRYILLLNPDTEIMGNCLGIMFKFMEFHPDVGASGCKFFDGNGQLNHFRSAKKFPTPWTRFFHEISLDRKFPGIKLFGSFSMMDWDRGDEREIDVVSGAFLFIRRDTIEEVGLLDERYFLLAEDIDWCYRTKKKGWKIMFNPDARIIHHGGKSIDQSKITRVKHAIFSNLLYFQKHHSRFDSLSFRFLTSLSNLMKLISWIFKFLFFKNKKFSLKNIETHMKAIFLSFTIKTGYKRE